MYVDVYVDVHVDKHEGPYIPYIWKYWRSLNLVICPKSGRNALLVEFKFGGLLCYVIA